MTLAWDTNPEPDVAGYRLHYGTTSGGSYPTSVDVGDVTTATISNLEAATTYYLVVTAYNSADLEGSPSSEVAYTTPDPPNVPPTVSLGITGAQENVTLAWDPNPEPDIVGYRLYYGTASGGPYPQMLDVGDVTSASLSPPEAGTYYFVVTAYNTENLESAPSDEVVFATPAPVYGSPATITLSATADDTDGTIDRVEFYEGSNLIGQDPLEPFTFDWAGVLPGAYTLTARAFDDDGDFSDSAPLSVTVVGGIEYWRQNIFGSDKDKFDIAGDLANPDGDEWPNIFEYVLGTDPLSVDNDGATSISVSQSELRFEFERIADLPDVSLVVETCPVVAEPWSTLATLQPGGTWTANVPGVEIVETDLADRCGVTLTKSSANSFEMVRLTLVIAQP